VTHASANPTKTLNKSISNVLFIVLSDAKFCYDA
jgi:hypothetical protein